MTRGLFNVGDLVQVAVEDERTGVAFYSALAEVTLKADLKKIFSRLAEDEKRHQAQFEQMLTALGSYKPREQYSGEYMAYLQTLTTERAFPDGAAAVRMARSCSNDAEAVELCARFERNTLALMNEMADLVSEKDQDIVRELIREEQAHLVALTEARKKLRK